jgi:hypothetical protein
MKAGKIAESCEGEITLGRRRAVRFSRTELVSLGVPELGMRAYNVARADESSVNAARTANH